MPSLVHSLSISFFFFFYFLFCSSSIRQCWDMQMCHLNQIWRPTMWRSFSRERERERKRQWSARLTTKPKPLVVLVSQLRVSIKDVRIERGRTKKTIVNGRLIRRLNLNQNPDNLANSGPNRPCLFRNLVCLSLFASVGRDFIRTPAKTLKRHFWASSQVVAIHSFNYDSLSFSSRPPSSLFLVFLRRLRRPLSVSHLFRVVWFAFFIDLFSRTRLDTRVRENECYKSKQPV